MKGRRVVPFPKSRRVIVDIGKVTATRPAVRGLIEADVTDALARIEQTGLSVTAFVIASFAAAIAEQPAIHAVRDWRGRLVIFDDIDIAISIEVELEGRSFPLSHMIRGAQEKTVADITRELRAVQATPSSSPSLQYVRTAQLYIALPGLLRRLALRALYRLPDWHRRILGTAGVSSIGMFGEGGGWGIGFPVHPVDLLVGGIDARPGHDGTAVRRIMALTLSFDHDIIDGAPAARFSSRLREMLEAGTELDRIAGRSS